MSSKLRRRMITLFLCLLFLPISVSLIVQVIPAKGGIDGVNDYMNKVIAYVLGLWGVSCFAIWVVLKIIYREPKDKET